MGNRKYKVGNRKYKVGNRKSPRTWFLDKDSCLLGLLVISDQLFRIKAH